MFEKWKAARRDRADQELTSLAKTTAAQLYLFLFEGGSSHAKLDFACATCTEDGERGQVRLDFARSAFGTPPRWLIQKGTARANRFANMLASGQISYPWSLLEHHGTVVTIGLE